MTQEELLSVAEVIERLVIRFENQGAEYEHKMAEHRDSFEARTEADAKIIEGLRVTAKQVAEARTIIDGQRASIDDLRNRLNSLGIQAAKQAGEALGMVAGEGLLGAAKRVVKERDALRAEVEQLRADIAEELNESPPTPKQHPVKVGDWVRRTKLPGDQSPVGIVKQVTAINCDGERYHFADGDFWSVDNCEPCAHQHPAQDGQWVRRTVVSGTEPVGTMIQVQRSRTLHSEYVTRGAQVVPWAHCEPCDPPIADHDTPQGKAAAEYGGLDVRKVTT